MIKANKNILSFLNIKSIYVQQEEQKLIMCIPIEFGNDVFIMHFSDNIITENCMLKILTENNYFIEIKSVVKKISEANNQYAVFLQEKLPSNIIKKLSQLESNNQFLEKRNGERFNITEKNYKQLGLKSTKGLIVINGIEIPCTLQDVSMNGVRLSFNLTSNMKQSLLADDFKSLMLSLIGLKLLFIKPLTTIFLILHPVRLHSFDKDMNTVSIGCKIKEPYNIEYSKKIINFVNSMEVNYVLEQSR